MEQIELINRVKTLQNFIFWTSIYVVLLWSKLLTKVENPIWILSIVFLIFFSYTISSIYFIMIGGYVGDDIFSNFMNFYNKNKIHINNIMKFVGYVLFALFIILGVWYIIIKLPDNYIGDRIFQLILVFITSILGAILLIRKNINGPKEN